MKTLYLSAVSKVRPGLPWNRQSIIISYSANLAGSSGLQGFLKNCIYYVLKII